MKDDAVISSANWRSLTDVPCVYSICDSHLYLHSLLGFTFSSYTNIMKNYEKEVFGSFINLKLSKGLGSQLNFQSRPVSVHY